MGETGRCVQELLSAIRMRDEYVEYKIQEGRLERNPELKKRVDQFRAANFRLQSGADKEELFQVAQRIEQESAELRKDAQVNAYLDAELALCRLMQGIYKSLTEGIEIQTPEW